MLCLIENYSSFSFLVKMEYAKSISLGSHVGGCPDFCNSYIIPSWFLFFFVTLTLGVEVTPSRQKKE